MKKGHFITFEGGDGAGKSSLIISLHAALIDRGLEVIQTRAPGGTGPGKVIRELLLHPNEPVGKKAELFLFLADRAEHVEKIIRPSLERGVIVLCDRYNDSTIAYQGKVRGFEEKEIERLCHFATGGLIPHLTIYLDIDPMIGLHRVKETSGSKDQIEAEDIAHHRSIRNCFLKMVKRNPQRFKMISAEKPKEDVYKEALKLIDDYCLATSA